MSTQTGEKAQTAGKGSYQTGVDGITAAATADDRVVVHVGSGSYRFLVAGS